MNNNTKFERNIENSEVLFTDGEMDIQKCVEEIVKTSTMHYESKWDSNEKYLWVLVSWNIDFLKIPKNNEALKISTEVIGHVGFFIVRNFKVYGDDLLINANSVWTIIDDKSRSIMRIPKKLTEEFTKIKRSDLNLYIPTIDQPDVMDLKDTITPSQKDIDSNGHVNNAVYFKWLQNTIPNYTSEKLIGKKLKVLYKKEILPNEEVCLSSKAVEDGMIMTVSNMDNLEIKAILEIIDNN